jgi:hypothetical protein
MEARMCAAEQASCYEIRVQGVLDARWSAWFAGLEVRTRLPNETTLVGPLRDQSELHGVLARVRDLGLPLIAVRRLESDMPRDAESRANRSSLEPIFAGDEPMTDLQPTATTNLDRYGNAPLPWSRAHDLLAGPRPPGHGDSYFLGTTRPDGRPHVASVGALWLDGDFYIVSGAGTRKSRNLAANPACTIAVALAGIDLTFEVKRSASPIVRRWSR